MRGVPGFGLICDEKGRLLPVWLPQITICLTIASSKLLLSILPIKHKTASVRKQGEEQGRRHGPVQAERVIPEGALSGVTIEGAQRSWARRSCC